MSKLYNVSSSPHVRSSLTTGQVMLDVILALLPTTAIGIYVHGLSAALTVIASIAAAVLTEFLFNLCVKKKNTIKDLSAVVTGLLLALCIPEGLPVYAPIIGSVFAILFVKCLFGGLGKNFMNPALAGRCFLLISFGLIMTAYNVDGVTAATPLADLANGKSTDLMMIAFGTSNGCIGSSAVGLLVGGIFLWLTGGITLEIPVSAILTFLVFIGLFGGQGFDPMFLLTHLCAGGVLMGAIFMATDPVTSPVTSKGQIVFGILVGFLCGLFRVKGSAADSVSYAIIISNLVVPLINEYVITVPYAHRKQREGKGIKVPKSAVTLCAITLLAGLALSGVFALTKSTIAQHEAEEKAAAYQAVCPDAASFAVNSDLDAAIAALEGGVYGDKFGKSYINEAFEAKGSDGSTVGYAFSVTNGEGFDGTITLSLGLKADGTITGVAFTELHETAGMGMRVDEEDFKGQFVGKNVSEFVLTKNGASAENEIDAISGATVSSTAVTRAVNAALDFFANNVK